LYFIGRSPAIPPQVNPIIGSNRGHYVVNISQTPIQEIDGVNNVVNVSQTPVVDQIDNNINVVNVSQPTTQKIIQNPLAMMSQDQFHQPPKVSIGQPAPVKLNIIREKNLHPSPRLPIRLNIIKDNKNKEPVDLTPVIDRHYTDELNNLARGEGRQGFESKGEIECRRVLHKMFRKIFPRYRPDFLINPKTNRRLELDCYNEELGIAVEYNGEQHYKWPAWPRITYEQFIDQLERDQLKLDLCDANGVYLVVVPYTVKFDMIKDFIMERMTSIIEFKKIKVYPIK
jgi:hypothetical protein